MFLQLGEPWTEIGDPIDDPARFVHGMRFCVMPWEIMPATPCILRVRNSFGSKPYARDVHVMVMGTQLTTGGCRVTCRPALQSSRSMQRDFDHGGFIVRMGLNGPERIGYFVGGARDNRWSLGQLSAQMAQPAPQVQLPVQMGTPVFEREFVAA